MLGYFLRSLNRKKKLLLTVINHQKLNKTIKLEIVTLTTKNRFKFAEFVGLVHKFFFLK